MRGLFQKSIAEGWMALQLQSDLISLVHVVRPQGQKPVIRLLESFATNNEPTAALKLLAKQYPLASYRCMTIIGDKDYRILQTDAPDVPDDEQIAALRWQLKDAVDFPLNDAAIDIAPIPNDQQGRKSMIFALVAPRSAVSSLMGQFNDAKITLSAIDVPEMALRNISALLAIEKRGHALLHIGPISTQLIVTHEKHLILSRRIDLSAGQLATASEERQTSLIERMGLELQRTLDAFERQYPSLSISGMTVCCAEDIASLDSKIKESLYIPISPLTLEEVIDITAIPELRNPVWQARNLPLIGGCLRD